MVACTQVIAENFLSGLFYFYFRIFPFVAADAVTQEEQAKKEDGEKNIAEVPNPVYYKNFFSPPVETEGECI